MEAAGALVQTTTWFFGPEIPFDVSCQSGDHTCAITETAGVSVTNEHSFTVGFNLGNKKRDDSEVSAELSTRDDSAPATPKGPLDYVTAAFNFGASWSWSNTKSSGIASSQNKPAQALNECGYWTFIPYYVTSCGSLTYAPYIPDDEPTLAAGYPGLVEPEGHPASCDGTGTTIGNFCQSTPYLDGNGNAVGVTVFVAMECQSNKPLAFCYQQDPYLQIGVSVTPDMFIDYLYAHTDDQITARDISQPATEEAVIGCFEDKWTGNFDFDPSWVQDGIGHAVAPPPPGVTVAAGV
ncbi:MAG: hypothetical protein Q9161_007849 [Pseudevernia consocians]